MLRLVRRTSTLASAQRICSRSPAALLVPQSRSCSSDASSRSSASIAPVRQYISLYHYTPVAVSELQRLRRRMLAVWRRMDVLGRVYISQEGINAQLTVPESKVSAFTTTFPELFTHEHMFFGARIAQPHATSETQRAADKTSMSKPFDKLSVRIRDQIVRDGFAKGHLDLQDSGASLSPAQWHARLRERNAANDASTLVLDVRNFYEHEIGRFDGATRIMVDTFRDTFDAVDEILAAHEAAHDGAQPREVMMYCTGGIRCEKVGAYLTQYKGIANVQKLHGGIVNYMRFLKESEREHADARESGRETGSESTAPSAAAATPPTTSSSSTSSTNASSSSSNSDDSDKASSASNRIESLFRGKNFVFDQRCVAGASHAGHVAEEVTPDVLGKCFQCGEPCNQHTNCANLMCHGLILQCRTCAAHFAGACSVECKDEVLKMRTMSPEEHRVYRKQNTPLWKPKNPNASASYLKFIKFRPVPPALQEHEAEEQAKEQSARAGA